ncbi:hypothetical protein V2A60_004684 [Cordyceps javanica]|uniref:Uncharacterized protein n=1 Tax=Cordyceps javanica TaxID=43265 RepID=A0A545VBT1_9HYPO|nr:hypothetical protein IF1G_01415 [Cordyceps javanica]TQW11122.1 hypothetical protein IF2G_02064 [Cordyceps javanica]
MPSLSSINSHRQSWPPTQLRLVRPGSANKSIEPRPLLDDIDEDPLTYFLTPNAEDDEDDDDDAAFSSDEDMHDDDGDGDAMDDFDAGIEVAGRRPQDWVRSVSPSTLDGLGKLRRCSASPDFDSDGLTSDDGDDDDGDEYIRFSSSPWQKQQQLLSPNRRLGFAMPPRHSFGGYPFGFRSRSPPFATVPRTVATTSSSSSSFPAAAPPPRSSTAASATAGFRGRGAWAASHHGGRPAVAAAGAGGTASPPRVSRPGHLWREPSADVWSIEEETEEELTMSETRGRFLAAAAAGRRLPGEATTKALSGHAKPTKRVRFLLP